MRILIATDAFPPSSGGSGWSTYELARGLRSRGHSIFVVQPYSERDSIPSGYDNFAVERFPAFAPRVPFVRNYFRNERLYPRLGAHLETVIRREKIDLIHAQHMLTGPAAVMAAKGTGIKSICTVRDYWPLCYWGDLLDDPERGSLCPGCSSSAMTRCLAPRTGAAWPLALSAIPYMRSNLRNKQAGLAGADVVVAVSRYVADVLRQRASDFAHTRIETIPNAVDVPAVRAATEAAPRPMPAAYALFVGKLARNKGAGSLVDVVTRARLEMPLVIVGDGPERMRIERDAASAGRHVKILGWLDRADVFRWLSHATLLIFPSTWPEPLSRVLIEASALSVPIAAMNTGGTPDIVVDEETGLLSSSLDELAASVARLAADAPLRARLGAAARQRAESVFDTSVVLDRMETLYADAVA
jgi:glycosyltransferase involved in cell wall biosynthesis